MKVGDVLPISIAGHEVGEAYVISVDYGGSEVTIRVPELRVRMAVATSLAPPKAPEPVVETVIDGVDRAGNNDGPVTAAEIPAASGEPSGPPAEGPTVEGAAAETHDTPAESDGTKE